MRFNLAFFKYYYNGMHYRIDLWVKNYTLKEYSLKCLNGEKISNADSLFFFLQLVN